MKKIILSTAFFLTTLFTNAQAVQDWTAGLPLLNNFNSHTISSDSQGNSYIIGDYDGVNRDFDPGTGVFNMSSYAHSMYVLKLDSYGNFVWAKQIGGPANYAVTSANSITIDASDNIYIAGYASYFGYSGIDFDPGIGVVSVTNLPVNGSFVTYILKLDSNGNHIWNKLFKDGASTSSPTYVNALKVDTMGNVYATGGFVGTLDFDPDAGTSNLTAAASTASTNIFIMKLSSNGSLAWAKSMVNNIGAGSTISDRGYAIDVDSSGNVYSTGYYSVSVDADPGAGVFNLIANPGTTSSPTTGANPQYVSKLNSNGNFVWAYDLKGSHLFYGVPSLVVTNTNDVILSGYNQGTDFSPDFDFGTGTFFLPNDTNSFVFKIDANASFIWAKSTARNTIAAIHGSSPSGLAVDASGNIYTTGSFGNYAPSDFDPSATDYILSSTTGASNYDGYVSKIDSNGNFVWANKIGGAGNELGCSITVSPLGKVTILGKTDAGFAKSATSVTTGGFLASYTQPALANPQFELNQNIVVYPNPSTGEFNIKINDDLVGADVIVYNILGEKIKTFSLDVLTTTQNLDKGMYLIEIEKNNTKTIRKLIIQ